MEIKKISVRHVKPGTRVILYDDEVVYVKNIYRGGHLVSPMVTQYLGDHILCEYAKNLKDCNQNYKEPEVEGSRGPLNEQITPSIFSLQSFMRVADFALLEEILDVFVPQSLQDIIVTFLCGV
jgi:hypothetical protein